MKLDATDVHKRYGAVPALDGLSLTIQSGSTFGLLGTNGAGKTTLFRLLVGHETADSGQLTVGGTPVEDAGQRVREHIGYLPEHVGFPARLTGREVLEFNARMRDLPAEHRAERIADALETVGLAAAADRRVDGYSNGMSKRLGLATALLARPQVLILDEPTAGLDPRGVAAFHRIIRRIGEETDATIVFSSHVLPEVEGLCDRIAVLHDGQLRLEGPVDSVGADRDVTVRLRPEREEDVGALANDAGSFGSATIEGRTVAVECPSTAVLDALVELDEHHSLDGFEVQEAGLDAAFHEAVAADGDQGAPSGRNGTARPEEVIER